jgi:SAM-dependent methyltransferase
MREITYDQQTINARNPLARHAHRARMMLAQRVVREVCAQWGTVVDFGAGPGHFLHELGRVRPDIKLIGHDPFRAPDYPEVRYEEAMAGIESGSVDVLTAFEVCEHLYAHEVVNLLDEAQRILKPAGALVISVPIMYGAAIVPKALNWMTRRRTLRIEYTGMEVLKSALGLRVARPDNPRPTHKGFDFRELRDSVAARFAIERAFQSPLPFFPWWLSSQYFMVCRAGAVPA